MALANNLVRTILLILSAGLSSCAPAAPSGIPSDASVHWSLKSDFTWTWTRNLELGCSSWMAKESWASVQLVVDTQCGDEHPTQFLEGRGVSYLSFEDHLVFHGYWPWTPEDHSKRMLFDSRGMSTGMLPCGHSLSASQLSELRIFARKAYNETRTAEEKRVLARVIERLAVVGNKPLRSGQGGCTDMPNWGIDPDSRDVWRKG